LTLRSVPLEHEREARTYIERSFRADCGLTSCDGPPISMKRGSDASVRTELSAILTSRLRAYDRRRVLAFVVFVITFILVGGGLGCKRIIF